MLASLHTLLSVLAGGVVAGLIALHLRAEERVLVSIVAGVALPSMVTYMLAIAFGLTTTTVLFGPVAVVAVAIVCVVLGAADPRTTWREGLVEARERWTRMPPVLFLLFGIWIIIFFASLLGRALVIDPDTSLQAGYPTVWADWAQHLTTESSFAVAGNVPPVNPLFSGSPLLYPFMPDFHSGELMVLGLDPGAALAYPGVVLASTICLLLVCIGERVGAPVVTGMVAAVMSVLGGGMGFLRVLADACVHQRLPDAATTPGATDAATAKSLGCTLHQMAVSPSAWGDALHGLGPVVMNQPRAYDGLQVSYPDLAMHNLQWPTPLMGWWLPQRSFLYGCAMVLCVMLILITALKSENADRWAWGIAGVIAGLLPLFHVHSLIALAIVLTVVIAWRHSHRWWPFVIALGVVAAPRMLQLAGGTRGSASQGNEYPQIAVGWLYHFNQPTPGEGIDQVAPAFSWKYVPEGVLHALALPFKADWWSFWWVNLGIALPLSALIIAGVVLRYLPGRAGSIVRKLMTPFPEDLLPWAVGFIMVFGAANVIVFQSWNWDNTKLFAYWYMGVGLLTGCLAGYLWKRWRTAILGVILVMLCISQGLLVVFRLGVWENKDSRYAVTGPFTMVSAQDRALATEVAAKTPADAIFVIPGQPPDPLLTIAGRTAVLGYDGWVWSYGIVYNARSDDVRTILSGCGELKIGDPACQVLPLMRSYGARYVEVDSGDRNKQTDPTWWETQHLTVVARDDHIVVYDVGQS